MVDDRGPAHKAPREFLDRGISTAVHIRGQPMSQRVRLETEPVGAAMVAQAGARLKQIPPA
jgi:hypothetical protein